MYDAIKLNLSSFETGEVGTNRHYVFLWCLCFLEEKNQVLFRKKKYLGISVKIFLIIYFWFYHGVGTGTDRNIKNILF